MSVFQNSGTLRCVHACNNVRGVRLVLVDIFNMFVVQINKLVLP